MLPQELERADSMDFMRTVEKLDGGPIRNFHIGIESTDFGVFVGNPFIPRNDVVMAAFDHEGTGGHQVRQFSMVGDISEIEFSYVVLYRGHVGARTFDARGFPDPFVEVARADGEYIAIEERWDSNRRLAAIG